MFRFTEPAPRALLATAALFFVSTAAFAQAAPNGTPAPGRSRRVNANRRARIQRNIEDAYTHRWEIAGGGGFLRFRTGQDQQRINQINFFVTPTYNLSPTLSVAVDVRGMYGDAKINNLQVKNGVFSPQVSEYTLTAGPQYRFMTREKYSLSATAGVGVALSKFGGDAKGLKSEDLGMWPDSNAKVAFSVSAMMDYNIYNNFALRVQPTYLGTTFGNTVQNNLGVNVGLVYRFGRQK
ncbi:opacity protein [Terriglobus roseus DSM 18391]|uniref:Opacity protein n=1 Tax=Terriglobus roseus (strain DSM 18391 / NRRL B-41598 / KBS 63) TaxID=926566 RepID=I3ZIA1_TERRK|nr:DUF481 domain-containing protein [Terriglobus roseus]AFL88969.1 opacity protein [Terriglobus roseus DSM 18391]